MKFNKISTTLIKSISPVIFLGILHMYEDVLINQDFIHLAQYLTKLPEAISADDLFRSIETIRMTIDKKRFAQILAAKKDARDNT